MLRSILMGALAGARSMTPLAAVANAARLRALPRDSGAPSWLGHPLVSAGALAMAAGELGGDKMKSAPDRIVVPGLAARLFTGALAGASYAPRQRRLLGAALGAGAAVAASYATFQLRMAALRRFGQTGSGLVEDALTVGGAWLVTRSAPSHA